MNAADLASVLTTTVFAPALSSRQSAPTPQGTSPAPRQAVQESRTPLTATAAPGGRVLPPVRTADASVRNVAQTLARKSGTKITEDAPTSGRAPAPLTVQPMATTRVLQEDTDATEHTMTLGELELLVQKAKRGVREVVITDDAEEADWDPKAGTVILKADSGAKLVSRMLGVRR